MVAHAVYVGVSLPACASEVAPESIAAIVGHICLRFALNLIQISNVQISGNQRYIFMLIPVG